jgi:hypothetical protein
MYFILGLLIAHIELKCIWPQSKETIGNVKTANITSIALIVHGPKSTKENQLAQIPTLKIYQINDSKYLKR